MPFSDPKKKKEHDRLSQAISRAKKTGKDVSKLITQRQKLIRKETKSREEINRDYYRKNRDWLLDQKKERHEEKREQEEEQKWKQVKVATNHLIKGSNIMVLMSFKEYTELNWEKQELWKDFSSTLQDLATEGIGNVVEIQKLELLAGNLVRDYYETAKQKSGIKNSWKSLSEEQQERLIKYWWREKVRIKKYAAAEREEFDEYLPNYLATREEIELTKFHEERGKQGCSCHDCQKKKIIREEIKRKRDEYWENWEEIEESEWVEGECANCYEWKKVSVDSGLCRKCEREQEEE